MSSTNRVHLVFSRRATGRTQTGPVEVNTVGAPGEQRSLAGWPTRRTRILGLSFCLSAIWGLSPTLARAQAAEPATAPPAATPPAPAPPALTPPVPTPTISPAQAETPPLATEAMPATREEKLPAIDVGAWVRAGGRIQGSDPKTLGGEQMDTIYGELHAGGKIHKNVSLTLNLNANGLAGTAGIEDAIIGFDVADPFHVWVGQLLVPVDRPNYGGPFFAIPWNYPGFLSVGANTVVSAPREGPYGRNGGVAVWGDVGDGVFHYAVAGFQTGSLDTSPLFSGRASVALIGKEKGYFGNATYFGDQDIVAIGVGGQYQNKGSPTPVVAGVMTPAPDNYSEFNADVLAEFKIGGGGYITGDAAYYHFGADNTGVKDAFYVLAAIATPKVGFGNIQPMVRYQWASGDNMPKAWNVDAFVNYLIMGPALRIMGGFSHTELGNGAIGNAIQLGVQAIFF